MINKTAVIAASVAILIIGSASIAYGRDIYEKVREIIWGGGYVYYGDTDNDLPSKLTTVINYESNPVNMNIERRVLTFTEPIEVQSYLAFGLKLPEYLPEGYSFDKIELYSYNNEQPSGQYADIYFAKGKKYIYIQARLMSDETAFAYGTNLDRLMETEINGYKVVMSKGNLDIDIDGVMYMFSSKFADVDSSELFKMAESIE